MKEKKGKKKARKRPEALAKDTLKFAIANGTIKDLLWDNDEQRLTNESESSEEEDLDDHAVEVYNELLLRNVPSVPESELLHKYRQQFIQEHSQPGTKPKHHQTPFPPTQEKGTYCDSPTRLRQTKLVQYNSGNPVFPKQPPVDRLMHKKHIKSGQSTFSVADPLPLTQLPGLGGDNNQVEGSHPHPHKHHHHDEQFHNHTHVSVDVSANLTSSLDLQFRPTSFGNIGRSANIMTEGGGRSFKRVSGFNLSSKAPEFRTVHEEVMYLFRAYLSFLCLFLCILNMRMSFQPIRVEYNWQIGQSFPSILYKNSSIFCKMTMYYGEECSDPTATVDAPSTNSTSKYYSITILQYVFCHLLILHVYHVYMIVRFSCMDL